MSANFRNTQIKRDKETGKNYTKNDIEITKMCCKIYGARFLRKN